MVKIVEFIWGIFICSKLRNNTHQVPGWTQMIAKGRNVGAVSPDIGYGEIEYPKETRVLFIFFASIILILLKFIRLNA